MTSEAVEKINKADFTILIFIRDDKGFDRGPLVLPSKHCIPMLQILLKTYIKN